MKITGTKRKRRQKKNHHTHLIHLKNAETWIAKLLLKNRWKCYSSVAIVDYKGQRSPLFGAMSAHESIKYSNLYTENINNPSFHFYLMVVFVCSILEYRIFLFFVQHCEAWLLTAHHQVSGRANQCAHCTWKTHHIERVPYVYNFGLDFHVCMSIGLYRTICINIDLIVTQLSKTEPHQVLFKCLCCVRFFSEYYDPSRKKIIRFYPRMCYCLG